MYLKNIIQLISYLLKVMNYTCTIVAMPIN